MTRKEKVEKISVLLASANYNPIEDLAVDILDALEEKPAPQFRDNEIVREEHTRYYYRYSDLIRNHDTMVKLSPAELAATCAPPDAKWWAVDDCNIMRFYKDEPIKAASCWAGNYCVGSDLCVYRVHCLVDDWTTAKGQL